jgi:hypothetical protein
MSPINIKCPICNAAPTKACCDERGELLPRFHKERVDAANQEDEGREPDPEF